MNGGAAGHATAGMRPARAAGGRHEMSIMSYCRKEAAA
jgi:hypothetical protein